jgi:hypothetical protein
MLVRCLDRMRDAIILSTWSWDTFNVPERIALALAMRGARVLYCENSCLLDSGVRGELFIRSRMVCTVLVLIMWGAKSSHFAATRNLQWRMVSERIICQASALRLNDLLFLYSHIEHFGAALQGDEA